DVVIERETMTLKANVVQAVFEPVTERENGMIENSDRKRSLSAITATGDIEFNQGVRTVYANRVVYFKKDEKMVFTGSPNIREGDDVLKGEKITVFIQEDRVVVEGGEAIIHPK
ncbi:MAG: LptA/OstA family protein, partial [Nitrospirota bacterium]